MSRPLTGPVLVTGTDTGVGKTVVTAAVAAAATAAGRRVAVVKPAQTGGDSDTGEVTRLARPAHAVTLAEYPEPLAPLVAARRAGAPPQPLGETVRAVRALADGYDLVLVEGAGGLLVPMGTDPAGQPWTVADLARRLGSGAVVVARAGLGTLNHTALTLEALQRRAIPAHVVVGAWPARPEPVHWTNLAQLRGDLAGQSPRLAGAVPEGAADRDPAMFRRSAPGWLGPQLYGVLDDWHAWATGTAASSGR